MKIYNYTEFINEMKVDIENISDDILINIKSKLNLIIKKYKIRNLKIVKISGFINDNTHKNNKSKLIIHFSNKDNIIAKLINNNNISITINDKLVYDIDNDEFNLDRFIEKISEQYKKYLNGKNWKIN